MDRLTASPAHEVRVVDGRFTSAVCSCGWTGGAHRTRSRARQEARDHALLYAEAAPASALGQEAEAAAEPGVETVDAPADQAGSVLES